MIIPEFCNLYIHSVSSQVLIFGESECQANVEENGLDFSQGMLCAEEGTCHVRRSQYFKREKLQKNLLQGDSGGALTVDGTLAGIVSLGGSQECAKVTFSS